MGQTTYTIANHARSLQFFSRDKTNNDSALVYYSGYVSTAGQDSMVLKVYRDGSLVKRYRYNLTYGGGVAPFAFSPKIKAELHLYKITLSVYQGATEEPLETADSLVAGQFFLFSGQSNNAESMDSCSQTSIYWRAFGSHVYPGGPDYNPADTIWRLARGNSQAGDYVGPGMVSVKGIKLMQMLQDSLNMPSCIINFAVGGSGIYFHIPNLSNREDLGTAYGCMKYLTRKAGLSNADAGFVWYQGESNCGYGNDPREYPSYHLYFKYLHDWWLTDYPNIKQFYVYQINITACSGINQYLQAKLREIQRQLIDSFDDVTVISTFGIGFSYDNCHYKLPSGLEDGSPMGYYKLASRLFPVVARDLFSSSDTVGILPPNPLQCYYSTDHTKINIVFDQKNLRWGRDTLGERLLSNFFVSNGKVVPDTINAYSYTITDSLVTIFLNAPLYADSLQYPVVQQQNDSGGVYSGPFLWNQRGNAALGFNMFIDSLPPVPEVDSTDLGYLHPGVVLRNSDNNADLHGTAVQYASASSPTSTWYVLGSGTTPCTQYLLPGAYYFKITYNGQTVTKWQNISSPTITFQTQEITMKYLNNAGDTELGAVCHYLLANSKTFTLFGTGTTETTLEMLPLVYNFKTKYQGKTWVKTVDTRTTQTIIFQQ